MPTSELNAPVEFLVSDRERSALEDGMALCLSGGGYRAMVFHIGAIWRLYEVGLLLQLKRVSSVSGGSITAAALGRKWTALSFDPAKIDQDFIPLFVTPLRRLAGKTIDRSSILSGIFLPGTISDRVANAYRKHLFAEATLQALPSDGQGPRFVINATNVQSGALVRFSKPYLRDWRVGEVKDPDISLATAVAASSAFPPVLSPASLELRNDQFTPGSGQNLQFPPYTTDMRLSDGGVYDNLGLETAWKRYRTILVSDAGGKLQPEERPKRDWAQHAYRVLDLIDNQVRSLRKRQLIAAYEDGGRTGAYWGIRTNIEDYGLADPLACPFAQTIALANIATRLAALDERTQERLINWGYGVTDAALRRHVDPALPKGTFPYPGSGV
jgi:NTE family protein